MASSFVVTIQAKKSLFWRGDFHPQLLSTTGAGCFKGFWGGFPFGTPPVKISPYSCHLYLFIRIIICASRQP
jgi:hypothetical protein